MSTGQELHSPNQYHLHGWGLIVSYFPEGFSPGPEGPKGPLRFTYHDSVRSLAFYGDEVRTVEVPDLGSVVSVTIAESVDVGNTTFSVLLPVVVLPEEKFASAQVQTKGITTIHRALALAIGHPQREIYTVSALNGTASRGPLPV